MPPKWAGFGVRALISALRSAFGLYLIVDPSEWPTLDEEVLVEVRRFLGATVD